MKPQSGKWIGSFTTQRGTTVHISLNLTFSDAGSVEGSFAVTPLAGAGWHGPRSGSLTAGTYSQNGKIHIEEATNPGTYGTATFDGNYTSTGSTGVIRGSVVITKGAHQENGELIAISGGTVTETGVAAAHVWGE